MKVTVTEQGSEAHVEVRGRIDGGGAEEMKLALAHLNLSSVKEVVFDFRHVTFIGSTGIGKLLALYKNMSDRGGRISLRNVPSDIHNMFQVVNLDRIFTISPRK